LDIIEIKNHHILKIDNAAATCHMRTSRKHAEPSLVPVRVMFPFIGQAWAGPSETHLPFSTLMNCGNSSRLVFKPPANTGHTGFIHNG
jgi:hypothetical protein